MKNVLMLLMLAAALAIPGCQQQRPSDSHSPKATSDVALQTGKIEKHGLHNVYRIDTKLFSGSSPEDEAGFRSLSELGIRTIISVDGAKPDVALAHKFGMRYVHIPVGYDGISRAEILRLVKAARDLPGPVYVHCHHGKHRGPTAAAAIHLCLDDKCSVEQALAEMKRAGTDPHYAGLYEVPRTLVRPSQQELDSLPADFSEATEVSSLAQLMVEIDLRWENLKSAESAGWTFPQNNPDLDPAHEALMLAENYHEAGRLPQVVDRPASFRALLAKAEQGALALEKAIRDARQPDTKDRSARNSVFQTAKTACIECHARYRDVPQ
jgi:protein tyrosine phosphatase (PTP) superfamily phosphohydrolase (DUF442 family)